MQSSFHIDELDFMRAADVSGPSSGRPRSGASGESLDALKARTTPMDITNPFVTPHASCELAFLATAISIDHRYDEIHLHLPQSAQPASAPAPALPFTELRSVTPDETPLLPALPPLESAQQAAGESVWHSLPEVPALSPALSLVSALPAAWYAAEHQTPHPSPVPTLPARQPLSLPEVAVLRDMQQHDYAVDYDDSGEPKMFSGTLAAGAQVHIYIDNVLIEVVTGDAQGHWQFAQPADLSAAQHVFSAEFVDEQGHVSSRYNKLITVLPQPAAIITPIDDSDLSAIDCALMELAMQQDDIAPAILPLTFSEAWLDEWNNADSTLTASGDHGGNLPGWDEPLEHHIVWH